ncbi:hypothetical protein TrST_g8688 [Triparma strigata]|uniref:Peroxisomal ATPase PEX1 n=1 Tax=Triparma strigata TaxID=1606541 RepID=A0A9W7AMY1_9STRA|nr:hypothetical protein TrST_g8688 [Triparma strigata]
MPIFLPVREASDASSHFIRLSAAALTSLTSDKTSPSSSSSFLPLKLSTQCKSHHYFTSYNGGVLQDPDPVVELPRLIFAALHSPTTISTSILSTPMPPVASKLNISPMKMEDWDAIELNAEYLEEILLSQYSVLFPDQILSVMLPGNFHVRMKVMNPDFPENSECALLKDATELIIEPNPRTKLPPSFKASKPLRLLPSVSDARREIPDWDEVWSKQYDHQTLSAIKSPPPLTIHINKTTLTEIPGYEEMSTQFPSSTPVVAIYKWEPPSAKKQPTYSYGNFRSPTPTKKIFYATIIPTYNVPSSETAVLPPSLRYSLSLSVFESVQIKVLSPSELQLASKLGDSVTPKLEGNFSLSKAQAKASRVFAPNSILFDGDDLTFSRVSKITAPTPPPEPPSNAPGQKPSNPDSLPPLFYLPLPQPTTNNTSRPNQLPQLPAASSAVFKLTPSIPIPVLGKEQASILQGLYDDIFSESSSSASSTDVNQCHLLVGAEGSGKTHIALNLCVKLRLAAPNPLSSVYVDFKMLQINYPKMNELLNKITQLARLALSTSPSVLILDNVDVLAPFIDDKDAQVMNLSMMIDQGGLVADHIVYILEEIAKTGSGVSVLITAKGKDKLNKLLSNPDFKRLRPPRTIQNYDGPDRITLFKRLLSHNKYMLAEDFNTDKFTLDTESCLPIDVVKLIEMIKHNLRLRFLGRFNPNEDESGAVVRQADIDRALANFSPSSLKGAKLTKQTAVEWDDIGGLFKVKAKLIEVFENPIKYRKIFENSPIKIPKGGILFGPTGCGKTLLGSAIAKKSNLNFISVKGPELLDKFIGASEAAVRDVFARAEVASPCLIFFDEFESLAPKRGNDSTGVTDRVVNQLLTFLDGVEVSKGEVFVLAATSRIDMIDAALLRPGRLDLKIEVNLPSKPERSDILKRIISKNSLHVDVGVVETAVATGALHDGYNAADIQAVCNSAYLAAVHSAIEGKKPGEVKEEQVKITAKHFFEAVRATKPSSVKIVEDEEFKVSSRVAFH